MFICMFNGLNTKYIYEEDEGMLEEKEVSWTVSTTIQQPQQRLILFLTEDTCI